MNKKNNIVNHLTLFFLKYLLFQLILGLTWQVDVIKTLTFVLFKVIDSITDANSECLGCGLGGLDVVWWWFGANMAGGCNKNAFKCGL